MDTRLDGQRAVVTAGAGGAGLVIAAALAAEGATVFVGDIDEAEIAALPADLTGTILDVADAAAVAAWLDPIVAEGIDILVNNAGIAGPTNPSRTSHPKNGDAAWRSISTPSSCVLSGSFR